MKLLQYVLVALCWILSIDSPAQNVRFEVEQTTLYRYPLHPLDKSLKTYSASIQEIGWKLGRIYRDSLYKSGLVIDGYEKVKADGDIQIELIMSQPTVTDKELKDQPITNEKDGVKTTMHQYWYVIQYTLPTKIRLLAKGNVITEQDFPGFFTAEYHPNNGNSLTAIQQEYDNDRHFLDELLAKKLVERKREIRRWLFSNYGYGFVYKAVEIGTIKDKKGMYPEVAKAYSLMVDAVISMRRKKDYIDDAFRAKLHEPIDIYEKLLTEHSEDKKARVNNKVAAMAHYNIALAYYLMREFDQAEQQLALIKSSGSSVFGGLKDAIEDHRIRLSANGLMGGFAPTTPTTEQALNPVLENSEVAYRDYVVFINGDTVYTKFVMPPRDVMPYGDSLWLQDQVIVYENDETIKVQAKDISSFSYKGVVREMFNRVVDTSTIPFKIEYKMCKRTITGAISLYQCYKREPSFRDKDKMIITGYPYYKKDGKFEVAMYGNFNKGVSKLVSDYPELSERVKNGEFMKDDLKKVVELYNAWAREKH